MTARSAGGDGRVAWKVGVALIGATIGAVALGYFAVQLFFLPETLARAQLDRAPDLTGRSLEEAVDEGEGSGYEVVVAGGEHDDDVEAGRVLHQIPPPDTYLPPGDTLRLLVSEGPGALRMPDLAGLEPALAERVLGWLGLSIAGTRREASDLHAQGTVVETVPPAGVPVEEGTAVTLVLSGGGSFLAMPDVRNLALAAARDTLASYGLTVGDVSGVPEASTGERRVVVTGQTPAAGRRTRAGTAVTLQLGEVASPAPVRRDAPARAREAGPAPSEPAPGDEAPEDRFDRPPPALDDAGPSPSEGPFEDVPAAEDEAGGGA